ncbi:peptidylprolyl isomerase [Labilibacter marinus]|uniref:peptidylprolyl isomerase n=1 Tax=Labilibacter marinus TaxID=1477105 RepID=UPI0008314931|nr:peptidylprolyl isomerase [Labilibacter marinus]
MNKLVVLVFTVLAFAACKQTSQKQVISEEEYSRPKGSYQKNIKAIATIETYDHYNRQLKRGYGFYISANTLVTNLDLIKGSYKAKVTPIGTDAFTDVAGYTAFDIANNLVIIKTWKENLKYIHLEKSVRNIPDSVASLYRKSKNIYLPKTAVSATKTDSSTNYILSKKISSGLPAFTFMHHPVGMVQNLKTDSGRVSYLVPSSTIEALSKQQLKQQKAIYDLRNKTNKVYPSYKNISGFKVHTTAGNFTLRLYNQTPTFRDNFIKLVSDQFYDSLLIHRVLKDFLIQTGAADSKYAKKDDIVGWQGPGYNLKTKIIDGLYHKRGAIAASKMPPERNPKDRSDGSQFYIISGRVFNMAELQEIEKDKGIKFTSAQIKTYTTIGGAPHLDGEYSVFGEITSGMEVVDKIAAEKTYAVDRPIKDIRIKEIEILKK